MVSNVDLEDVFVGSLLLLLSGPVGVRLCVLLGGLVLCFCMAKGVFKWLKVLKRIRSFFCWWVFIYLLASGLVFC